MTRVRISEGTAARLMFASDMTCNICMRERGHLEIHHINGNPGDRKYENLILLCRNCHSKVTAKALGRNWSAALLLKYKSLWEGIVSKRREDISSGNKPLEESLVRKGAERVVRVLENYMMKRDAHGVLALFTPPKTTADREWLEKYMLGGDLGRPGQFVRLFGTRGFGYKVVKYDIKNFRILNHKRVEVGLEEWRTSWNDGEWSPVPRRINTRLVAVKVNRQWFVEKYTIPSAPHYRRKYGGLGG